jgi:ligand-binding SRPBCC domain-containing protein
MKHVLERSTWIPRPVDEVSRFFSDVGNLERITPPELRFRILTPLPVEIRHGALIDYQLSLFGVPFGWRTEITCWEPPHRFVDTQLSGPYRQWIHLHEFTPEGDGTRMRDRVDYVLPLGVLGLAGLPLVRRQLDRIFDFREAAIREWLG